jgi:hypothetical protein
MNPSDRRSNPVSTSNEITRRDFMKKSALTAGAISVLGQGIGFADPSDSIPSQPEIRTYQRTLYITGTDANGNYTFTADPNQAQVFTDTNDPDRSKVSNPTGTPPGIPSWEGAQLTEVTGTRKDIQTNNPASADSPKPTVSKNLSVVGDSIAGYRKAVQVIVTYIWTYP